MAAPSHARIFVQFNKQMVQDPEGTLREGRPIYKEVDYIRRRVPGDNTNVVHRQVRPSDLEEFGELYESWKKGEEDPQEGTPLKEWPGIARSQVEELRYFHVFTVEQLAAVSDGNLQKMGPLMKLRQAARDYIEKAKGEAPLHQLRAELDKLRAENDAYKQQIQGQADDLKALRREFEAKTAQPVIKGKG